MGRSLAVQKTHHRAPAPEGIRDLMNKVTWLSRKGEFRASGRGYRRDAEDAAKNR
jgi:hypothetical protein